MKKTISASVTLKILSALSLITGFVSFLIFIFIFINNNDTKLLYLWVGMMIGTYPSALVMVWIIYYLKKPTVRAYWIIVMVMILLTPVIGVFGLLSTTLIFVRRL